VELSASRASGRDCKIQFLQKATKETKVVIKSKKIFVTFVSFC